jgi:hypothetical protein
MRGVTIRRLLVDERVARLLRLLGGAIRPAPGAPRIALALSIGILCHLLFTAAVLAMILAMFFGMSHSLGRVPWQPHIPGSASSLA